MWLFFCPFLELSVLFLCENCLIRSLISVLSCVLCITCYSRRQLTQSEYWLTQNIFLIQLAHFLLILYWFQQNAHYMKWFFSPFFFFFFFFFCNDRAKSAMCYDWHFIILPACCRMEVIWWLTWKCESM